MDITALSLKRWDHQDDSIMSFLHLLEKSCLHKGKFGASSDDASDHKSCFFFSFLTCQPPECWKMNAFFISYPYSSILSQQCKKHERNFLHRIAVSPYFVIIICPLQKYVNPQRNHHLHIHWTEI